MDLDGVRSRYEAAAAVTEAGDLPADVWTMDASDPTAATGRPAVQFEPCMRFGEAQIRGISADAIVSAHWVGDDAEEEYGLSRAEVLVACWYVARHGPKAWRKRWDLWLRAVEMRLWREEYDEVELPPTREDGQ